MKQQKHRKDLKANTLYTRYDATSTIDVNPGRKFPEDASEDLRQTDKRDIEKGKRSEYRGWMRHNDSELTTCKVAADMDILANLLPEEKCSESRGRYVPHRENMIQSWPSLQSSRDEIRSAGPITF